MTRRGSEMLREAGLVEYFLRSLGDPERRISIHAVDNPDQAPLRPGPVGASLTNGVAGVAASIGKLFRARTALHKWHRTIFSPPGFE
jgi:hypothetical protein